MGLQTAGSVMPEKGQKYNANHDILTMFVGRPMILTMFEKVYSAKNYLQADRTCDLHGFEILM